MKELNIIGKSIGRHDAKDKVLGMTKYADDFSMPGMLYGKALWSKYPAANILSINTSKAFALPGVKAVLTAKDVPNNEIVTRMGQTHKVKGIFSFEGLYRVLADKRVHFLGEAVALVAAETEEIAEEARDLIEVQYEPLPGVFNELEALKPEAFWVQEGTDNTVTHYYLTRGDVEKGFGESDVIVENAYHVPFVDTAYIEPESGVAWVDDNGVITIRVATQVIEHFRDVAEALGINHNRVRVIAPYIGGGFGGKEDVTVEIYLALLAQKTRRPVKMTWTREESILSHCKRHPFAMFYKTAAKKDGRLTALQVKLVANGGAYVTLTPWVLLYALADAAGPYRIPNVKAEGLGVLTNNTFASANRGFGGIQPCFAYESQMDELAKRLGMEPLEIRRINYIEKGETLSTTGQIIETHVALPQTAEKAWEAVGEKSSPCSANTKIGRGVASGMIGYGRLIVLHDTSRASVQVELDGSVVVRSGIQDIGGGQASSLCQIAAEVLGVPYEDVRIYFGDTAQTPLAGTTTATRQLYMSGNATLNAAKEVRKRLLTKAGEMMETGTEDLEIRDKKIFVKGSPGTSLSLAVVAKACASDGIPLSHEALFKGPFRDVTEFKTLEGKLFPDFTFGSIAAEVAVDEDTGK
ncbi:MAG: xanthine dehydrogenase family protein molybdopterin-binding subunit, partial [Desulfobacteraceae bacterium]|nr:xanthine dehydrogenase family protein molybdopterin-binding subunit [Desulfobacteraceae bacterium]